MARRDDPQYAAPPSVAGSAVAPQAQSAVAPSELRPSTSVVRGVRGGLADTLKGGPKARLAWGLHARQQAPRPSSPVGLSGITNEPLARVNGRLN